MSFFIFFVCWWRWGGAKLFASALNAAKFRFSSKKRSHHFTGDKSEWKHDFWRQTNLLQNVTSSKFDVSARSVILYYRLKSPWSRHIFEETSSVVKILIFSQNNLRHRYFVVFAVKFRKLMIKCSNKLNWAGGG